MSAVHNFTTCSANCWIIGSVLCPILTLVISYSLALSEGNFPSHAVVYFPLDTMNEWPNRAIGTFGLGLSAWCMSHLFYYHFLFLSERLPMWRLTTFALLLLGEVCTVFVLGAGVIGPGVCPFLHSLCTYNSFIGFNIYIAISTWLMDTLITRKYEIYSRGLLRTFSAVVCPIMFILFLTPNTGAVSKSLAEIGLFVSSLLWVASQYNVWGRVYVAYDSSLMGMSDFAISEYIISKYDPDVDVYTIL